MIRIWSGLILVVACCMGGLVACGDDDDDGSTTAGKGGTSGAAGTGGTPGGAGTGGVGGSAGAGGVSGSAGSGGGAQTPPQGAEAVKAWLASGFYKAWDCEAAPHEARSPSPHGPNRICTNDAIATNATGTGPWPAGAAAVKELYANAADATPAGYAVYLKTQADSAGGAGWYWFIQGADGSVGVDGLGGSASEAGKCVGCHSAAGADAEHTPTPGGRDYVYTPVQSPPQGAAAVDAWLAAGRYKQWASEPEVHAARSPSPHGFNRIYSNNLIAANASGTDAWPAGAAAVKELYPDATTTTPSGYAVYLKTRADSAGGANWYWYEIIGANVVADGLGDAGPAKGICVGCHAAAGADAEHTPTPGGRDQVYTPVPLP